jgi:hypothetical protein
MPAIRLFAVAVLLCAAIFMHPQAAHAAESYDNCKGFITSLPATVSTQGVWCLKGDLSTAINTGNAITINANNVTIDCNDFKIGGLAAGDASQAYGTYAGDKLNTTVRHCNIRGFIVGAALVGAGNLLEDNRFDNNLLYGILCTGCVVRRNRVYDTGGLVYQGEPYVQAVGIVTNQSDVVDNLVDGVFVHADSATVTGITATIAGLVVRGNTVRDIDYEGQGDVAKGISVSGGGILIERNFISAPQSSVIGGASVGIDGLASVCVDNSVYHFVTATASCSLESNTHSVPGI